MTTDLVTTARIIPTILPTRGDTLVASRRDSFALAPLALFALSDAVALPWSAQDRQLTLFAEREAALARLAARRTRLTTRLARTSNELASRPEARGARGGARSTASRLREELDAFTAHLRGATGPHLQLFFAGECYLPWREDDLVLLAELFDAIEGDKEAWGSLLFALGLVTANPTSLKPGDMSQALVGTRARSPCRDALVEVLEADGGWLMGLLAQALAPLGLAPGQGGRRLYLADVLGALSLWGGEGVALKATTHQGALLARRPTAEVLARLPPGSLPALARVPSGLLFSSLKPLWKLAASGALADGPVKVTGLVRQKRALA